ncbi:MAG TPA: hypothetical protein VMV55_03165 [Methanoregula sp.]|nr:hypothetical protein [Methanoregula sp.]
MYTLVSVTVTVRDEKPVKKIRRGSTGHSVKTIKLLMNNPDLKMNVLFDERYRRIY